MMKILSLLLICTIMVSRATAQKKSISQIKTELEKSINPPLYVRDILKKKFILDTIAIRSTTSFQGRVDSLAYHGKIGKVYGPFDNGKVLVQIMAKSNTTFNRLGQIFIDTTVFLKKFADSLSLDIVNRVRSGSASFEDMAQAYSMGGEAATKGDIGWMAAGSVIPQIEKELKARKKGDVFRVWSPNGVHIIRKSEDPKEDTGYVLLMRVLL